MRDEQKMLASLASSQSRVAVAAQIRDLAVTVAGLSDEGVAQLSGMSLDTYQAIMTAPGKASAEQILLIYNALGQFIEKRDSERFLRIASDPRGRRMLSTQIREIRTRTGLTKEEAAQNAGVALVDLNSVEDDPDSAKPETMQTVFTAVSRALVTEMVQDAISARDN